MDTVKTWTVRIEIGEHEGRTRPRIRVVPESRNVRDVDRPSARPVEVQEVARHHVQVGMLPRGRQTCLHQRLAGPGGAVDADDHPRPAAGALS